MVETIAAQRVEGWNGGQTVTVVKQQIVNVYNAAPTNDKPKLLFILGHVPVARSGLALEAADNHPENEGALASDAYYADIDGIWTDTGTHTSPTDPNNTNIPGDYKWDQNYIPSELELAFGRVDFADIVLPTTSEIQLYKNYLNKLHNYRHVASGYDVGRKIAIRAKGYEEGLDSSYRNGLPIVGSANIVHQNNDTWLSDTGHANWVNSNGPFLAYFQNMWKPEINLINQLGGLNAMLYSSDKSYWGLWGKGTVPVRDGKLDEWLGVGLSRALLATGGLNLIVLWGTSPASSIFFQAGIGETVGYSMKRSMDHDNNKFNIFEYHGAASGYGEPNGHYFLKHCKTRHSQFNGDPSIRFFSVKPVSNLVTTTNSNSVSLTWNSSSDTQIIGYHVYRSNEKLGKYTKLTTAPVTSTSYIHNNPVTGDNWYMVKAITQDASSEGIFVKATIQTTPSSTITIDFENLPLGDIYTKYDDPKGFTFQDDLNGIIKIFGTADFYPSKVLHPSEWYRQIFLTRTNDGTFDLKSFQYGVDIYDGTVEATVTGYLTSGGTVSQTYTVSSDDMQTLNLNWKNLSSVKIDFATGADGNYGALDNFVLVAK